MNIVASLRAQVVSRSLSFSLSLFPYFCLLLALSNTLSNSFSRSKGMEPINRQDAKMAMKLIDIASRRNFEGGKK